MKPSKQGMPSMHTVQQDTGEGWHMGCCLPEMCCNVTMYLPHYFHREEPIECTSIDTQTLWKLAPTSPLNYAVEQQGSLRALWVSDMIPMSLIRCIGIDRSAESAVVASAWTNIGGACRLTCMYLTANACSGNS